MHLYICMFVCVFVQIFRDENMHLDIIKRPLRKKLSPGKLIFQPEWSKEENIKINELNVSPLEIPSALLKTATADTRLVSVPFSSSDFSPIDSVQRAVHSV